jgi:hypothetical protein
MDAFDMFVPSGDIRAMGATELLDRNGRQTVVLWPCSNTLHLGMANARAPEQVPHCLAFHSSKVVPEEAVDPMIDSREASWPWQELQQVREAGTS